VRRDWTPDLLEERIKLLGDLVVKAPWEPKLREKYNENLNYLKSNINKDLKDFSTELKYHVTRTSIAEHFKPQFLPVGVYDFNSVAAYRSAVDFKLDFEYSKISTQNLHSPLLSNLGLSIRQQIEVPDIQVFGDTESINKILKKVIELAKNKDFKNNRRKLYDWQEEVVQNIVNDKMSTKDALQEMDTRVKNHNEIVKSIDIKTKKRFLFVIAPIVVQIAQLLFSGHFDTTSIISNAATSAISIGSFVYSNKNPIYPSTENDPAAIIHDINKDLKWSWKEVKVDPIAMVHDDHSLL